MTDLPLDIVAGIIGSVVVIAWVFQDLRESRQ